VWYCPQVIHCINDDIFHCLKYFSSRENLNLGNRRMLGGVMEGLELNVLPRIA
jgi:hypothetical protein